MMILKKLIKNSPKNIILIKKVKTQNILKFKELMKSYQIEPKKVYMILMDLMKLQDMNMLLKIIMPLEDIIK